LNLLFAALLVPSLFWDRGPETAALLLQANIHRISVPASRLAAWKAKSGFTVEAADPQQMQTVPAPAVKFRRRVASATAQPWVDSNGWRFLRNPGASYFYQASGRTAALAAAEAFAYGVHASISTDDAGLKPLGEMIEFLCHLKVADFTPLVNIGFIDDGSPQSGEFMNLLVRRNLLFRVVPGPDPSLDLTAKLGMPEYPASEANPAILAEKVRANLSDEKRLLRLYGSELVIGRLVGNRQAPSVFLLNYGAERLSVEGIRVKVRGDYTVQSISDFGSPGETVLDPIHSASSSEFTLKDFSMFAVVNLVGVSR
jgi:hypothetical protein